MMEVEKILGPNNSNTEMEVFRTVMNTFKSYMADFLLRAEKRHTELDNMVYVYRFCEQVSRAIPWFFQNLFFLFLLFYCFLSALILDQVHLNFSQLQYMYYTLMEDWQESKWNWF